MKHVFKTVALAAALCVASVSSSLSADQCVDKKTFVDAARKTLGQVNVMGVTGDDASKLAQAVVDAFAERSADGSEFLKGETLHWISKGPVTYIFAVRPDGTICGYGHIGSETFERIIEQAFGNPA